MNTSQAPLKPPAISLLWLEAPRAISELGIFYAGKPLLGQLPRGDGHPVLILPGMAAGDLSTRPLRRALRRLGYYVHGWRQGVNTGRSELESRIRERLEAIHALHGQKVSLIGWSLGGIYARELAKLDPARVRDVITLGSPFAGDGHGSNVARLYHRLSGRSSAEPHAPPRIIEPPPLPSTALYSRSDGVVAWRSCLEPTGAQTENIEVYGSHCGLGHNPSVLYAVADRLAQPEGQWTPFHPRGWRRTLYPQS